MESIKKLQTISTEINTMVLLSRLVPMLQMEHPNAIELIDTLSNADRLKLRTICDQSGITKLPRNLYYNYTTQQWINGDDSILKQISDRI